MKMQWDSNILRSHRMMRPAKQNSQRNSEARQILEQQSDLADIYLLPLTIEGGLVTGFEATSTSIPINLEAVNAAKVNGYDLRTYTNQLGIPVRLLTYVVTSDQKAQVFQAGRFLYEQQRVLSQLLRTMIIAGGIGNPVCWIPFLVDGWAYDQTFTRSLG